MIDYTAVIDVYPEDNTFIMKPGYGNPHKIKQINVVKLSPNNFTREVFLYRKWLKSRMDPNDRVAPFEAKDSNGVFSFDKYANVFNSRLKPGEEDELIRDTIF